MTNSHQFTEAEIVFMKRMLPHFMAGKDVVESAKSVVADDERLMAAFFDRGHSQYVPTADERGSVFHTGERQGDVMVRELSAEVYKRLRA
jgi:hypothetical protein